MLVTLIIVFSVLLLLSIAFAIWSEYQEYAGCTVLGIILAIIFAISLVISIVDLVGYKADVATASSIDEKIIMYEEENTKIEEKINATVTTYLSHEQGTLTSLTPENAANVLVAYPELKSDTLVVSQIETYISNSEKIKELKEEKIDLARKKWWINYGK